MELVLTSFMAFARLVNGITNDHQLLAPARALTQPLQLRFNTFSISDFVRPSCLYLAMDPASEELLLNYQNVFA